MHDAEALDSPATTRTLHTHAHTLQTINALQHRAIDREVFLTEAGNLRAAFDKHKDLAPESGYAR